MSSPERTSHRPVTAPPIPNHRRVVFTVEPDPVDVRCYMCMAQCIKTFACMSNEGRVRLFCTELCMNEYVRVNLNAESCRAPSPDSPITPPATRRVQVYHHNINTSTSNSTSHIDLSKRASPRNPEQKNQKRIDAKKVEDT